jgi:hypothetical protein
MYEQLKVSGSVYCCCVQLLLLRLCTASCSYLLTLLLLCTTLNHDHNAYSSSEALPVLCECAAAYMRYVRKALLYTLAQTVLYSSLRASHSTHSVLLQLLLLLLNSTGQLACHMCVSDWYYQ